MQTVLDILTLSADYLAKRGVERPRRQAEELLADLLRVSRMDLYLSHDKPIDEQELQKCREWLKRRGNGEPLQYIVGEVEFLDCHLTVTPDVLIPRPETEILADTIAKYLKSQETTGKHLWDVCCGSGCLGIALKKKVPSLSVTLVDICPKALAVAAKNATDNGVEVACVLGDLLRPLDGQRADYVVCNPPYVSVAEYEALQQEVREHEPKGALVSGSTGLEFYQRLAVDFPAHLAKHGRVWLEIGSDQGAAVSALFSGAPWVHQKVEKDWSGRDRFFSLEIE
jgi:release factor glutamine methyltransferase